MWKIESLQTLENEFMDEISSLDKLWMRHHWSAGQWKDEFSAPNPNLRALFLLRDEHNSVKGLNLYELNPWSNQAHLLKIALDDDLKGSGAAKALFEHAVSWMRGRSELGHNTKEIYLEVDTSNQRAIRFYKKMGFVELCEKKGFYSDGADALAMLLSL